MGPDGSIRARPSEARSPRGTTVLAGGRRVRLHRPGRDSLGRVRDRIHGGRILRRCAPCVELRLWCRVRPLRTSFLFNRSGEQSAATPVKKLRRPGSSLLAATGPLSTRRFHQQPARCPFPRNRIRSSDSGRKGRWRHRSGDGTPQPPRFSAGRPGRRLTSSRSSGSTNRLCP